MTQVRQVDVGNGGAAHGVSVAEALPAVKTLCMTTLLLHRLIKSKVFQLEKAGTCSIAPSGLCFAALKVSRGSLFFV